MTADHVIGVARGQASGDALQWACTLRLPVDGSVLRCSSTTGWLWWTNA